MKHASLAAHYRPQTFAEVTGQDMITTVLSRAAAEDRMAAAYLLSGTRGVGKTTIARILAKALNCVHAPTAEPCNECANCQMITKGNHVDVTEIDGASNNSVEDARALRENIGYAPMEGRYKVFIIDEAHMLSRSAFNALLKTLEEPPPRVVFIFATTEVHKFPITIVSRCQHFIFKRLSEDGLVAHLSRVLGKEGVEFDPQAVRTIARRANGSVRDSMSLLSQTLALGESTLSMESTRAVLGLAGQELFMTLMEGIAREDCPAVMELMHKLSDQGIDMGFFLRELISLWRTLFLLREAGQNILPSLQLSAEDSAPLLTLAAKFSAAHLHAAWHMTLDAQRKIIHSPEPAAALELLLINLTLMPRLLPLQAAPLPAGNPNDQGQQAASSPSPSAVTRGEEKKNSPDIAPRQVAVEQKPAEQSPVNHTPAPQPLASNQVKPVAHSPVEELQNYAQNSTQNFGHNLASASTSLASQGFDPMQGAPANFTSEEPPAHLWEERDSTLYVEQVPSAQSATPAATQDNGQSYMAPPISAQAGPSENSHSSSMARMDDAPIGNGQKNLGSQEPSNKNTVQRSWEDIVSFLGTCDPPVLSHIFLQQATGRFAGTTLHIHTKSLAVFQGIERVRPALQEKLEPFCQQSIAIEVHREEQIFKSENSLVKEFSAREDLKDCLEILDASIYKVRPLNETT